MVYTRKQVQIRNSCKQKGFIQANKLVVADCKYTLDELEKLKEEENKDKQPSEDLN